MGNVMPNSTGPYIVDRIYASDSSDCCSSVAGSCGVFLADSEVLPEDKDGSTSSKYSIGTFGGDFFEKEKNRRGQKGFVSKEESPDTYFGQVTFENSRLHSGSTTMKTRVSGRSRSTSFRGMPEDVNMSRKFSNNNLCCPELVTKVDLIINCLAKKAYMESMQQAVDLKRFVTQNIEDNDASQALVKYSARRSPCRAVKRLNHQALSVYALQNQDAHALPMNIPRWIQQTIHSCETNTNSPVQTNNVSATNVKNRSLVDRVVNLTDRTMKITTTSRSPQKPCKYNGTMPEHHENTDSNRTWTKPTTRLQRNLFGHGFSVKRKTSKEGKHDITKQTRMQTLSRTNTETRGQANNMCPDGYYIRHINKPFKSSTGYSRHRTHTYIHRDVSVRYRPWMKDLLKKNLSHRTLSYGQKDNRRKAENRNTEQTLVVELPRNGTKLNFHSPDNKRVRRTPIPPWRKY